MNLPKTFPSQFNKTFQVTKNIKQIEKCIFEETAMQIFQKKMKKYPQIKWVAEKSFA